MTLTQVSTGGIKDGQVQTADLADAQITAAKLHADALDHTYTLGASGTDHYTFTGEGLTGAVNDPTLYLTRGKTYRFVNGNSSGAHPFRIQSVAGAGGTEYNTGVTNNAGAGGSTIIFEVPHDAPDVLYYICTSHASMNGIFYVTGALADGTVTTAKLADDAVTNAKINGMAASKLTGTVPDARISASSVTQHVTAFDDNTIINDISALALKVNALQNATRYNTNSTYVDTFQDSNGIASFTTSARNADGEYIASAVDVDDYQSYTTNWHAATPAVVITQSSMGMHSSSRHDLLMDGSIIVPNGNNSGGVEGILGDTGGTGSGAYLQVDFGSGAAHKIIGYRGFEQVASPADSWGGARWTIQISADGSNWTSPTIDGYTNGSLKLQNGAAATVGGQSVNQTVYNFTNNLNTTSRYFRWYSVNSGSNSTANWLKQINFKMRTSTTNATGSAISNVITAPSSTTKMGVVVTYIDQSGTATLNTDLKLSVSADNGSNFTQVTLVAQPNFSTGVKMAVANDVTVTAGTQLKYKVEFANQAAGSKETRVTGVSLQY